MIDKREIGSMVCVQHRPGALYYLSKESFDKIEASKAAGQILDWRIERQMLVMSEFVVIDNKLMKSRWAIEDIINGFIMDRDADNHFGSSRCVN